MAQTNEELIHAIEEIAAHRDSVSEWKFYQKLLDSALLVAIDKEAKRRSSFRSGDTMSVPLKRLGNSAGQSAALGFTGLDELNLWSEESPSVEFPAKRLFQILVPVDVDVVILNIGGPIDATIDRAMFASLAQGIIPLAEPGEIVVIPAGTTQFYRQAVGPVADAVRARLQFAISSMDGVSDAYLLEQRKHPDGEGSILLAVGFKTSVGKDEKKRLIDQLGAIPSQVLQTGQSLYIQEMSDKMKAQIAADIEPLAK